MEPNENYRLFTTEDIRFLQSEQTRLLGELHKEIERLKRRCSDLQFSLAVERASSGTADEELKREVEGLRNVSECKSKRIDELVELQKWKELEYKNKLSYQESKIKELQRSLVQRSQEPQRLGLKQAEMTYSSLIMKPELVTRHKAIERPHSPQMLPYSFRSNATALPPVQNERLSSGKSLISSKVAIKLHHHDRASSRRKKQGIV